MTAIAGRVHLGTEGEAAAADVLAAWEVGSGFECCAVVSEYPAALAELKARLQDKSEQLYTLEPDARFREDGLHALAAKLAMAKTRAVVWLEQDPFDEADWRSALSALNQDRSWLRSQCPALLVLAGPPALFDLAEVNAPDFWSIVSPKRTLKEAPAWTTAGGRLRWLHLSDLHFKETERWDRRATLQALLRKMEELKRQELAPDLVVVTGDIANSGKRKEYEQAERFFAELAQKLGLTPREHWFLVPGNHDVNRTKIGRSDTAILAALRSETDVEETLADSAAMKLLGRRLEEFYAFTERLLGPARGWREDLPWRTDVREIGGTRVGVLQLNSTWAGGTDNDQRHLLVGEAQVRQCLEATRDAFLRIALLHHPLSDLREFDEDRIDGVLSAGTGVHFLLRGHRHKTRSTVQASPDGRLTQIAAGTLYVEGRYPRGFNLAEVDLKACRATLHFFRYSSEGHGFWAADTQAYEQAPQGVWTLSLPETLCSGGPANRGEGPEATAARLQSTAARYRQAAAAYHGRARFIGFADHRPHPNTTVGELYVPLRLTRLGQDGLHMQELWAVQRPAYHDPDGIGFPPRDLMGYHGRPDFTAFFDEQTSWTTATVVKYLCSRSAESGAARIVVLGGPGSGKTTLCRFLSVVIAGEVRLPDMAPERSLIPLLLPFREYTHESASLSIIEFLYRQAGTELSIALPEGFLENVLEAGQAVLLLDGLDEVGRPEDRATMRDRVLAFCRAYPRTPLLVTSRIAGYDEAPLAADGRQAFAHLQLAAFEDEDLREFVRRWYAIQEPDDPVARDRGIADLSAAMTAEPRITELARNPMLATLIALIHRFEAHLPGERAKLYELCIKTLLDTWPAATGRQVQEIDTGLQRVYLEKLAYAIQWGRQGDDQAVVIDRDALIPKLSRFLGERALKDMPEETRRHLAERWVNYLQEGSGLLVEQSTGQFAFFHLSFLEYLAAKGWEREPDCDLPKAIAERFDDAAWREVCLLAVGVHAEDGPFLDRLFEELVSGHPNGWPFLLRALREEACFTPEQRARILAQVGTQAFEQGPPFDILGMVEDVIHFSVRNGRAVRMTIDETLRSQTGEALMSTAALRLPHAEEEVLAILESRRDTPAIARTMVDFWPGTKVGDWAAGSLEPSAALDWAKGANELVAIRGMATLGLRPDSPLPAALSFGLAVRALRLGWLVKEAHAKLSGHARPGGHGMPESLLVRPGDRLQPTEPCLPLDPPAGDQPTPHFSPAPAGGLIRFFADSFARDFVLHFGIDPTHYKYANLFGLWFARSFTSISPFQRVEGLPFPLARHRFFRFFSSQCAGGFAEHLIYYLTGESLGGIIPRETRQFAELFSADIDVELRQRPRPPTSPRSTAPARRPSAPGPWLAELRNLTTDEQALKVLQMVMAALGGENIIAVAAMAEASVDDCKSYFSFRLQNRWLCEIWPALDDYLSTPPGPWQLAIYYALAWTQFSTTWTWPETERWGKLFGERAPAHWLPRTHWHLCWLSYDPGLTDHLQGLDEAVEEGEADTALPGYAFAFREVLGRPGGSKEVQG
jgi:predicted MPP superfamily phosphohydrolase